MYFDFIIILRSRPNILTLPLSLFFSLLGSVSELLVGEAACALPDAGVSDVCLHAQLPAGLPLLAGLQEQDHSWLDPTLAATLTLDFHLSL